jgi:YesN/AraC family two-component response regulator
MALQKDTDLKIVVVDDSDLSRRSIIEILERYGYEIVGQASSAEDALPMAGTTPVNLFIIDIVMPEVSGLELAKTLSELSKPINIITMSSLDTESIVIESISAGALDFLVKPFDENQLIQSVEKIKAVLESEG